MRKLINEAKILQLFEERGVAISPYKKELDNIALYIRRYIKKYVQEYGYQRISFSIPHEHDIKAENQCSGTTPIILIEITNR